MNEPDPIYAEVVRLRAINTALLAALRFALAKMDQHNERPGYWNGVDSARERSRAVIAKAQPFMALLNECAAEGLVPSKSAIAAVIAKATT